MKQAAVGDAADVVERADAPDALRGADAGGEDERERDDRPRRPEREREEHRAEAPADVDQLARDLRRRQVAPPQPLRDREQREEAGGEQRGENGVVEDHVLRSTWNAP